MSNNSVIPTAATRNGLVGRLLSERHSLPLSVVLHLLPGALVVAAYLLIGQPFIRAIHYPTLLGWAIALCLVLIPILLGLLWLGRRGDGRVSLGALRYTDRPLPRGKLMALVGPLIVWMAVLSVVTGPVNRFFLHHFFGWVPFTSGAGSFTGFMNGYSHSTMVVTMLVCLPLTGVSLPLIEELYFRGFLLPRLAHLGGWAPVASAILFSLYHFWTPWVFVSRVLFMFPGFWLAWRHRDIRVSIGMHVGVTSTMAAFGALAVVLNLV
ncbi:CPBP family intramembrane glutamic endopeptidase [Nocardia sp. CDC160]|uniref:CPBP family intramembrane glutamic endopeptidase n=1 Tax=Nocardia sp. CDC160 TaxID=3112166 RepID=UPI002DBB2038|nr:CPBP family intramembrane glutamic endopeptidase [Nocardia sp. CDC160]MEC3919779.1 CPBP family intramembrane glutamic endopeptidase [Nocardia sp. CDC160]